MCKIVWKPVVITFKFGETQELNFLKENWIFFWSFDWGRHEKRKSKEITEAIIFRQKQAIIFTLVVLFKESSVAQSNIDNNMVAHLFVN